MTLRRRGSEGLKRREESVILCVFLDVFSRETVLFPLHADYHAAFVPAYCRVNDCRWISRPWESYWETLLQSPNGPYPSPALMNLSLSFSLFPFRFILHHPSRLRVSSAETVLIPLPLFSHSLFLRFPHFPVIAPLTLSLRLLCSHSASALLLRAWAKCWKKAVRGHSQST